MIWFISGAESPSLVHVSIIQLNNIAAQNAAHPEWSQDRANRADINCVKSIAIITNHNIVLDFKKISPNIERVLAKNEYINCYFLIYKPILIMFLLISIRHHESIKGLIFSFQSVLILINFGVKIYDLLIWAFINIHCH
jgi:hypothetical protein